MSYARLSAARRTTVGLVACGDLAFTTSGNGGGLTAFLAFLALLPAPSPLAAGAFAAEALAAFFAAGLATLILSASSSTAFSRVISSGVTPSGRETLVLPHLM